MERKMDEQTAEVVGNAQPATDAQEAGSQGAPDVSGFQQRINELTAAKHAAERSASEAQQGFQQAMERLARLEGRLDATAQPQRTEPGFDYTQFGDAADPLKKLMEAQQAQFQRQLQQMNAGIAAQLRGSEVATLAAQMGLPPDVAARANHLASGWAAQGLPYPASDAVNFAVGEAVRAGTYKPGAPQQQGRYMGPPPGGAVMHGGQGGFAPAALPQAGGPKPLVLPTNFEDMTPAQQESWMAKNKQNGDFEL
jgi:hypothetical protein